ncbi:MAG: ATP-binding cassette domain-containing protein, partial [Bacteroidales bacterium]|nr:ATP-binding cassette domain-containing protein [Bacteroidales bacterium]
ECGAACLGMILAWYKKWLPLEQLRKDCGVSRDGCNARQIMMAARNYGMETTAYRMEPDEIEDLAPSIIHWNFNHYVVYKGKRGKYHYINDPGKGAVKVTDEDFNKSFTGVVLTFKPGAGFSKGGSRTSILGFVRRRLKNTGAAAFFIFVTGVLAAITAIATPVFSQIFMDDILSGKSPDFFWPFMCAFLGVLAVSFLTECLKGIYMRKYNAAMELEANTNFFWHILRLPVDFFSQRYLGDIMMRQKSNQSISGTLVQDLAPIAINMAMMVLYLIFMLKYSILLTIIGLGSMVLNMVLINIISTRKVAYSNISERNSGKYYGVTMSCLENIESIKAAGAETGFFGHWAGYLTSTYNSHIGFEKWDMVSGIFPQILQSLTSNAILLTGAWLIMDGQFTIGMLMAFQGFMYSFTAPSQHLISSAEMLIQMRTKMERVEDVLNYPVEEENGSLGKTVSGKLKGAIELKNVTFGYNNFSAPQIQDFSMKVEPGKSVAIVGMSGCGKSTIAKLITGLYPPTEGEILFDGRHRSEISNEEFMNSVAMVDQNAIMFDDTIASNIKMWDSSIEDFAMHMACNDAQIREDIVTRPEGFNTRLVKGGKNFSGGQIQRMEIATALAREPVILIMDEATSALDVE